MKISKYHAASFILIVALIIAVTITIEKSYIDNNKSNPSTASTSPTEHTGNATSVVSSPDSSRHATQKSPDLQVSPLPAKIAEPTQPAVKDEQEKLPYRPPLLENYSSKIPPLYSAKEKQNVDYYRPPYESEEHLTHFKKLSDSGDAYGKFLYANRLWYSINKRFEEEYLRSGGMIDKSLWRGRYDEVSKLYIESAAAGIWISASQLPVIPNVIEQDNIEGLTWALISDKIQGQGNNMLTRKCNELKEECTTEMLSKAVERAIFYIDFYEFKTVSKSASTQK